MTFRGGVLTTTALVATLSLCVTCLVPSVRAATNEELEEKLRRLEAVVRQQQKTIEAQAEKLDSQADKLEAQARRIESQAADLRAQKRRVSQHQQQIQGQGALLYQIWETTAQQSPTGAPNGRARNGGGYAAGNGWIAVHDPRIILAQEEGAPRPAPPILTDEEEEEPAPPPVVEEEEEREPPVVRQREPRPAPPVEEEERPSPPATVEEERPEAEKPREQALLERGAILLPAGRLQVEPAVEYSRFSSDRIAISGFSIFEAIIIGLIRVDDLNRDVVNGSVTGRLGVLDRLQLDVRVPGIYRRDSEVLGVATPNAVERTISTVGLGDISGGVSYQPLIGGNAVPDVILRTGATIPTGRHPFEISTERVGPGNELRLTEPPTGNGFYSVEGTTTFVWSLDPVVLFTGGGYTWNMARDFGGGAGRVNPGDTIEFFAGTNVALSERVSLNLTFVNQRTGSTSQNGEDRPGSSFDDARLIAGTSIALSPNMSLLVSTAAGLTDTSPDFAVTISLPITFDLF